MQQLHQMRGIGADSIRAGGLGWRLTEGIDPDPELRGIYRDVVWCGHPQPFRCEWGQLSADGRGGGTKVIRIHEVNGWA